MEILKIEKGKTYTYEEIKKVFNNAMKETINNPFGEIEDKKAKEKTEDPIFQLNTMLAGMVVLQTMKDNMFVKEEKKDE